MNLLIFHFVPISLFFVGLLGIFFNRKNILLILMSLELVLLSINFNLFTSSCFLDDSFGQLFAIFVLTVAAAESSIGLAILVIYYRKYGNIVVRLAHSGLRG
jgi:NADH-quinone oxidoreductase subunit K